MRPILAMLNVCEIFKSIQGESTRTGIICSFVRLSGCNLSCTYCDTPYARQKGTDLCGDDIIRQVENLGCSLVEITGGEPLLQKETPALCRRLIDKGYTVLVETNGSQDIAQLPNGCIRIMDIKSPGSGCSDSFLTENLDRLTAEDECKMVLCDRGDFLWACDFVRQHTLHETCTVLFSPDMEQLSPKTLAEWILEEKIEVRLGLQIHKIIWGQDVRGV